MNGINPTLMDLAKQRVWQDVGGQPIEKSAVVPPDPAAAGGAPPMGDPAAGGAPPMGDPAAGGAMPMDPAMAGGAPGAMPMDPSMGAMGGAPGAMPADPNAALGAAAGGQKMKPEQMMQMLDFRLYNIQQQLTAIMNAQQIDLPPGALVTPPGSPTPVAEAAVPGGPQDPGPAQSAGEGDQSAISAIDPIQGASPELAAGGGGEKISEDRSFADLIEKMAEGGKADTKSGDKGGSGQGDVDEDGPRHSSPPNPALRGPHPGKRPATQATSAGGSQDPKSRTNASDDLGPVNKAAAFGAAAARVPVEGTPVDVLNTRSPSNNAAAVAALLRQRTSQRQSA